MKEVLFFTHNLGGGGAEKAVRGLAAWFNENPSYNIHATILVVYDDPGVTKMREGIIVLKVKSRPEDNKLIKAINVLRQMREVRGVKKRLKIDTCVSFLPGADIINVFSGTGERQVVSMRTTESKLTPNIFKKIYTGASLFRCDRIVAVTEAARLDAIDFFRVPPDKITTIHNAIDEPPEQGAVDEEFTEFAEGHRVIVNVGRMISGKRQDILIRAFAAALEKISDLRLVIIGDGEWRDKLHGVAETVGVSDKVLFLGHRTNPRDYLRRSFMFVLSSSIEGMPNVILEAMQCGLPVVATDCGVTEIMDPKRFNKEEVRGDFVRGEYGLIAPNLDDSALGRAIIAMADDEAMREHYIRTGAERLKAYSWERIGAQWAREL